MSNNEKTILEMKKDDEGIVGTIKKGTTGYDILQSILLLLNETFTGKDFIKIETVDKVDMAFEDLKRMYKRDYLKGDELSE